MANEITVTTTVNCVNGGVTGKQAVSNLQVTQTTKGALCRSQTVPTSDTVITLTGITATRWVSIVNKDASNFIDIGPTSGGAIVPMIRLKAGEVAVFPIKASVVLRAQADTASVIIEYLLLET